MQFNQEFGIIFSWRILRMLQRAVSEVFSTLSSLWCILQQSDMISSLTRCFTLQLLYEDQNHLHQWRCWSCINITCKVQLITRETDIVLPLITFTSVVHERKEKSFVVWLWWRFLFETLNEFNWHIYEILMKKTLFISQPFLRSFLLYSHQRVYNCTTVQWLYGEISRPSVRGKHWRWPSEDGNGWK